MPMFDLASALAELLKNSQGGQQNYPGGSPTFDEKHPDGTPMEFDGATPVASPDPAESVVPRPIKRSPFGQAMDDERRMR